MKKTLSFLIAAVLALTVFSAVAFSDSNVSDNYAEETNLTPTVYEPHAIRRFPDPVELPYSAPEEEYPKYLASKDFAYSAELLNTIEDMLKDALTLGIEQVDVSHLQIMPDDLSLYFILTYSPYFNEDIDITPYIHKDGCYSHVKLYSKMNRDETRDHFAKIDEKLSEISDVMSGAKTNFDKALLLHDYLVYNAEYDKTNYI